MRIVRFKNGKYGVRRFNFYLIGFEFLSEDSKSWHFHPDCIPMCCYFESITDCLHAIEAFNKTKRRGKKDIGKSIGKLFSNHK